MKELNKLAKEIIEANQYMTLGTVSAKGEPWVSPVAYAHDKEWSLYFVSLPDSKHCVNSKLNNRVSVAIFDSQQALGEGVGLQMRGLVEDVDLKDLSLVAKTYFSRKYPYGRNMKEAFSSALKNLINGKVYRFYRFVPTTVWMNDPRADTDVRVEVMLK